MGLIHHVSDDTRRISPRESTQLHYIITNTIRMSIANIICLFPAYTSIIPTFISTNKPHSNTHLYKRVKFCKIYKCQKARHHRKI